MTENYLLIDQGNTRLKWILARNRELQEETAGSGDFKAFTRAIGDLESPMTVLLSSVVGNIAGMAGSHVGAGHAGDIDLRSLIDFCKTQWNIEPLQLNSAKQCSQVRNGYKNPEELGTDRWLAIAGAVARHGKPVVVWDLGTATTIDAVDEDGQHIGGMIYPGPATMLNSLNCETKLKVPFDLSAAGLSPGRSTADGIGNGVLAAQVGALNQFLRHTSETMGANPKLVITGGAAGEVIPLLDFPCTFDPWLVFRGMLTEGIR